MTIQMKAIEQYFHVVLFIMLCKVILTFKSVDKTLTSDHSNEKASFVSCRFSSVSKGTTWSIVLYSITAAAASREQHWREASQAFYRVSMVYSNMQATANAGTTPTRHVLIRYTL